MFAAEHDNTSWDPERTCSAGGKVQKYSTSRADPTVVITRREFEYTCQVSQFTQETTPLLLYQSEQGKQLKRNADGRHNVGVPNGHNRMDQITTKVVVATYHSTTPINCDKHMPDEPLTAKEVIRFVSRSDVIAPIWIEDIGKLSECQYGMCI